MQTHFEKTLYKSHSSGAVGSWSVAVTGEDKLATMVVSSRKKLDGAEVKTPTQYTKGKNIGKANETSPLQQAILEAESKVKLKLDKGYVEEIPKAGSVATNTLGFIQPMTAHPAEKVKKVTFPLAVQPKLDGHRCLAGVKDGIVVMYSRQGKVINLPHILTELQALYDKGQWSGRVIDGELYLHGDSLQSISSLIKKLKPESENLHYHVYDIDLDKCYRDRFQALKALESVAENCDIKSHWSVLGTTVADTQEQVDALHAKHLSEGYEGSMLRQFDMPYESGKRSKSLLKKKDFKDDEFTIVGVSKGKPNIRLGLEVGIYECQTKEGKTFTVTAPGNAQERHDHAQNGHENIGRSLTVKYFNYTPDGVPFLPVALRIREDI